ncbi:uncharacterized protein LOC128680744 [Plodia interpunctella]|uniref:uncharacterized protein LOC128680744 n=1 Tax=Plodia interpunctella TaxID=58824 RepID=UPI002368D124|nr:uncharacterized protein LOC128680744 [Plodia interpunctella]
MNGKCLIIFYIIFYISRANSRLINPIIESDDESNSYDFSYDSDDFPTVRSSFAKTVTKFSCMADIDDAELLLYGTKAWRFPEQDINLTLTYPPEAKIGNDDYLITGFKVLLFVDTVKSKGYINSGGILEDHLSLSFLSPKVNMLSYQFWLYGVPNTQTFHDKSIYIHHDLC